MWTILCPECGEPMRNASIRLEWDPPATTARRAVTIYEHFDASFCEVSPATGEGVDNILGELRQVKGLKLYEMRPEGEATRQAQERWAKRISN